MDCYLTTNKITFLLLSQNWGFLLGMETVSKVLTFPTWIMFDMLNALTQTAAEA